MKYRLLALDLDGTVMGKDLAIAPEVRAAVAAAQERGVHVTIATGRMFFAALPYAQELGIATPIICYQGGMVRHPLSGEMLHHIAMPAKAAAEALRELAASGIFAIAYIDERLYIAEQRPELDTYLGYHPEGVEVVVAPDIAELVLETPPTKILFLAEPPVVERELARMAALFGERLSAVRSHALFGELTAPGISKGTALAMLAADLGVRREETVAIGDQENDIPMIAWAGLGLAMGNAIPAAKAAARAVIPPVEEAGVAWAIQHYLLTEG
ncbi:MAG TPA: Cof-type HAD-IIB family hydrolase [Roseiflexaceae bacterium]|nr:Cof-type HAD-IIB family hydrolase [Roseiflexaceae bacterium]